MAQLRAPESGIKDFELVVWYILLAPTGTPKDVVARLNKCLNIKLKDSAIKAKLGEMSSQPTRNTTEDATAIANKEAALSIHASP